MPNNVMQTYIPHIFGSNAVAPAVAPAGCPLGIIEGRCDTAGSYKMPASTSDFYTTWSFYMVCISLGLACVYVVANEINKAHGKVEWLGVVLSSIVAPLAVWGAANSIGVLATSQQLLGWNFTQSIDTGHVKAGKETGITLTFADYIFRDNFWAHIVPGLAAIVILLLVCCSRSASNVKPWHGIVAGLIAMVVFVGAYMCTPCAPPVTTEDGKPLFAIGKINYVYNDPQAWMFISQAVLTVLVLVLVPLFMAGPKLTAK